MTENKVCEICRKNKGKYSCPQCYLAYCSVPCYQSESHTQCSENFYKQWVYQELKSCQSDSEGKKKMMKILQQNQEIYSDESLDSDDDEAEVDLATRIKNIDLNDEEALWKKLTPAEQQEFKKLMATGNIVKILPEWEPWWKIKKKKTLIQDCSEPFDFKGVCPCVPPDVPQLKELTSVKPSPNVAFMLLNVLASYVFTVRWFKGAHQDMPVEGISTCVALSATLRSNNIFINSTEAFLAFENDFSKCKWIKESVYDKILIQGDLVDIIKSSDVNDLFYGVKAAICDLNLLCLQAQFILKKNNMIHLNWFSGPPPSLKLLQKISKKMNYYLSWTIDHGSLLMQILQYY